MRYQSHVLDANGHDPPKNRRGKGDFDQLFARGILVFEDEHRLVLSTLQKSIMRSQFWKAFNGEEVKIGPDKGPTWSADQMFALLPKFDRLAEP